MANGVWKLSLNSARLKSVSLTVVVGSVFQMPRYHLYAF